MAAIDMMTSCKESDALIKTDLVQGCAEENWPGDGVILEDFQIFPMLPPELVSQHLRTAF